MTAHVFPTHVLSTTGVVAAATHIVAITNPRIPTWIVPAQATITPSGIRMDRLCARLTATKVSRAAPINYASEIPPDSVSVLPDMNKTLTHLHGNLDPASV